MTDIKISNYPDLRSVGRGLSGWGTALQVVGGLAAAGAGLMVLRGLGSSDSLQWGPGLLGVLAGLALMAFGVLLAAIGQAALALADIATNTAIMSALQQASKSSPRTP